MDKHIVASIICAEFRKAFEDTRGFSERSKGMKVTFNLRLDYTREEGYRKLEMLIFGGGSNYISVFGRLAWTVVPVEGLATDDGLKPGYDYTDGSTPWVHFSCHDSCWTSDGVESVLSLFNERVISMETRYDRWYEAVDLSDEELEAFQEITRETRAGRATHSRNLTNLEFQFAKSA